MALVSLIWTLGLGQWGRDIPWLGEGWAVGTKQWGLSLSLSTAGCHTGLYVLLVTLLRQVLPPACVVHLPGEDQTQRLAGSLVPFGNTGQFLLIT